MTSGWLDDGPWLFAVFVGGKHPRSNIEVHDVQFVVARSIEETVPALRHQWWGTPSSLHIDGYALLRVVDGTAITPVPQPHDAPMSGLALYFVNTGGYRAGEFGELHSYSFHISKRLTEDKKAVWAEAKRRAIGLSSLHRDNFDRIDDIICVDDVMREQRYTLVYDRMHGSTQGPHIVAQYIKL